MWVEGVYGVWRGRGRGVRIDRNGWGVDEGGRREVVDGVRFRDSRGRVVGMFEEGIDNGVGEVDGGLKEWFGKRRGG